MECLVCIRNSEGNIRWAKGVLTTFEKLITYLKRKIIRPISMERWKILVYWFLLFSSLL